MGIRLELRRQQARRLALMIPLRVRLLPALVSGWLLYALAGAEVGLLAAAVAVTLFVLCALAALYEDRWTFDLDQKKVSRRLGLLFAARETALDMGTLERVVLSGTIVRPGQSERGRAERWTFGLAHSAVLALEDSAGKSYRLEQWRGPGANDLRSVASEIASFCGLPLEDRTESA